MSLQPISNASKDILIDLNHGGDPTYLLSNRKIPTFQPHGESDRCPATLSITTTTESFTYWSSPSLLIPQKDKDDFWLQAPSRLPGLIWCCNPETAAIAGSNYIFRELSGEPEFSLLRHLQAKERHLFNGMNTTLFNIAQLMHLTAGCSERLPLELKLNTFFTAAYNLLMDISNEGVIPLRPSPPLEYLLRMGLVLDTCLPGYQKTEEGTISLTETREDNRRPTFWTNLTLHNRCVKCDQVFGTWDLLSNHSCPAKSGYKCGLCAFEATSDIEASIHYTTICTRPVSTKCYNCNQETAARPCACATSWNMAWSKIRDYVLNSHLFRPDNVPLLQSIMALHATGRISFTNTISVPPLSDHQWNLKITSEDMIACSQMEEKLDSIISGLPRLENPPKLEAKTLVIFPKNPSQSMPMNKIMDMAGQLSSELKASQQSHIDQVSNDDKEEEQEEEPLDMPYFFNKEPPLLPEEANALENMWKRAGFEEKIRWEKQAINQDSGNFILHLYQSGAWEYVLPNLPPFKDKESARADIKTALNSQIDTLNWIHSVRSRGEDTWTKTEENKESKKINEPRENKDGRRNVGWQDEEQKEDGEEGGDNRKIRDTREQRNQDTFTCNNEGHVDPKPTFNSNLEKMRHVKRCHACPFAPQCTFFNEFDAALLLHIQRSHPEASKQNKDFACRLCDAKYKEQAQLAGHMERDHPTCAVCKLPFASMVELRQHQPCLEVKPDVVHKKTDLANGLLVPIHKAELEGYRVGLPEPSILLAQGLADLCEQTAMPADAKDAILKPILQATALIEAQRKNKLYPFQAKAVKWPLIQAPSFDHAHGCRESNKFSDFLGTCEAKDRWHPSYLPSKALPNFYYLKRINDKLSSCVAACHLSRETATVLLKQRIHPDTMSAMEAKSNTRAQDFRYEELLLLGQSMFFQLSLEKLQHEAESLAKEPEEKFHEYFTRCFHLLSTAALGHDEESRSKYVQFHLRRQLLRTLSPALRLNIENAELELGVEYTASNILDFYMSNWQMMEERSGALKSQAAQLSGLPIQRIERNKGQKKGKSKKKKSPSSISQVAQGPPRQVPEAREQKGPSATAVPPTSPSAKCATVAEGRSYRNPPLKTDNAPTQPSPRAPFQGMAMNGADTFKQVSSANKRAEYAIATKAKLGLPPHDMSRFCFRCGAGNAKSSRPYHPAKECKLPPSDMVHSCPAGLKLLHEEKFCPFGKSNRVGGVSTKR